MKRVLRWTAVLFGIGLIGMAGMLAYVRSTRDPRPILLFSASEDGRYFHQNVYAYGIGSAIRRQIIPTYLGFNPVAWSPDGEWFYLIGSRTSLEYDSFAGEAWRLSRDGRRIQRLANVMVQGGVLHWTPDGQWIVTDYWSEQGMNIGVYRISPDGRVVADLTPNFDRYATETHISLDGQWIYFVGTTPDYQKRDIYRMPIAGGAPETLTEDLDNFAYVLVWPDMGESVIAVTKTESGDWRLNKLNSETHQWLPFYEAISTREPPLGRMIRAANHFVLVMPDAVVGIDAGSGEETWRYEGTKSAWFTFDSKWLILQFAESKLARLHPDGLAYSELDDLPVGFDFMGAFPNSQSILLESFDVETGQYSLYEFEIEKSRLKRLWTDDEWVSVEDWSPDGKWFVIHASDDHLIALHIASRTVLKIHLDIPPTNILALLPPIDRAWSPVGLLVIGSVLMLGGVIRRGGRRKT
ncbi:MAG: hypothetical protein K8L91_20875 [Anaerolineae bacterium]|nr:hypothetical protein [Anaerolineae bacterium]